MTKNYYTTEHQNIHDYQQRRNYFSCEVTTFPDVDYTILPEEYAIFNQISTEFFHKNGTRQGFPEPKEYRYSLAVGVEQRFPPSAYDKGLDRGR